MIPRIVGQSSENATNCIFLGQRKTYGGNEKFTHTPNPFAVAVETQIYFNFNSIPLILPLVSTENKPHPLLHIAAFLILFDSSHMSPQSSLWQAKDAQCLKPLSSPLNPPQDFNISSQALDPKLETVK